jgi:hypothetical protein
MSTTVFRPDERNWGGDLAPTLRRGLARDKPSDDGRGSFWRSPYPDHPGWITSDHRASWHVPSDHGVRSHDRSATNMNTFGNRRLGSDPHVVFDHHRHHKHLLSSHRNLDIAKTVVVIANRDHLGNETVTSNRDRVSHPDCHMVPEYASRTDVESSATFERELSIHHDLWPDPHAAFAKYGDLGSRAHIATCGESRPRVLNTQEQQPHPSPNRPQSAAHQANLSHDGWAP